MFYMWWSTVPPSPLDFSNILTKSNNCTYCISAGGGLHALVEYMNDDDVMEIHDLLVMSLIFDSQISFTICNAYIINSFVIVCIKHILFFCTISHQTCSSFFSDLSVHQMFHCMYTAHTIHITHCLTKNAFCGQISGGLRLKLYKLD